MRLLNFLPALLFLLWVSPLDASPDGYISKISVNRWISDHTSRYLIDKAIWLVFCDPDWAPPKPKPTNFKPFDSEEDVWQYDDKRPRSIDIEKLPASISC